MSAEHSVTTPHWLREGSFIAHRGLHDETLPENTLGAFRHAAEKGLPIELDLQMTADSKIVVFHDRTTKRLTGKKLGVTKHKLATLQQHPILGTEEPMPTLEQVLKEIDGVVPLLIEVKPAKIRVSERAAETARVLENYGGDFALQSFDPRIVRWFKRYTSHPTGLIMGRYRDPDTPPEIRERLENFWLREAKNQQVSYSPDFIAHDFKLLTPGISDHFRLRREMPLITWTVREERQVSMAQALADGYIFEGFLP